MGTVKRKLGDEKFPEAANAVLNKMIRPLNLTLYNQAVMYRNMAAYLLGALRDKTSARYALGMLKDSIKWEKAAMRSGKSAWGYQYPVLAERRTKR
jgi:hypothetical protein